MLCNTYTFVTYTFPNNIKLNVRVILQKNKIKVKKYICLHADNTRINLGRDLGLQYSCI